MFDEEAISSSSSSDSYEEPTRGRNVRRGAAFDDESGDSDGFDDLSPDAEGDYIPVDRGGDEDTEVGEPEMEIEPEQGELERLYQEDASEPEVTVAESDGEPVAPVQTPPVAGEISREAWERGEAVRLNTAIFEIHFGGSGFRVKVDPRQLMSEETKQAADVFGSSHKLIDSPEFDAVRDRKRAFQKWLARRQVWSSMLKGGMYRIPLAYVDDVEAEYARFHADWQSLLDEAIRTYPERKAQMRQHMEENNIGNLYNEQDYMTEDEIRARFVVNFTWTVSNVPDALKTIKKNAWEREVAKLQKELAETADEGLNKLRQEYIEFTEWLLTQLESGPDGKRKAIGEKKFADMQAFFETGKIVNVGGNEDFNRAIEIGQQAILGVDIADLKKNGKDRVSSDQMRARITEAFKKIKEETATWVVTPGRALAADGEV